MISLSSLSTGDSWNYNAYGLRRVINFGDDTSDTGNYYAMKNKTEPSSNYYYKGRFSNNMVWPETLAQRLNIDIVNYAYAFATADNRFFERKPIPFTS
ncbi:hypothetical protein DSO57_1002263 [Entomophthora muscae]|uniref:Uncharacterized protein n=1 Tax=Entomophthora muscae TaxID=34485 RepID=A0ACC2TJL2_9FUNG|nr:hypothetical protein DSO57_1002263 [Entomophthora muscae]